MRDVLLQCAGWLAIATSLAHGILGETKVFARASIEPKQLATLLHGVWQAGTVAWIAGGVLLVAAPGMGSEAARHWIIVTFAVVFGSAALGNAWALRGRQYWLGRHERRGGAGLRGLLTSTSSRQRARRKPCSRAPQQPTLCASLVHSSASRSHSAFMVVLPAPSAIRRH